MPHFRVVVDPCGRREIVEVVEPRPPDHPVLGPLAIDGDPVARFLLAACSFEAAAAATAQELHRSYGEWAGCEGHPAMTATAFGRRLTQLGFRRDKKGAGFTVRRLGLRLRRDATRAGAEAEALSRRSLSRSPGDTL